MCYNSFKIKSNHCITSKDIVSLCESLNLEFGSDHIFVPGHMAEGGIIMQNWPNKKKNEIKCFRFGVFKNGNTNLIDIMQNWPIDVNNILEKWKSESEKIIFYKPNNIYIGLSFEALHGASYWTLIELRKVERCFNMIGFERYGTFYKQ